VDGLRILHRSHVMSIAPTLQKYLAAENIQYEVIPHELSMTSTRTAEACHISGDRLAKGIVLRRDDEYMLAVLPASHHLRLSELRTKLGDNIHIADETEINRLFGTTGGKMLWAGYHRRRQHRGTAGNLYGSWRSRDAASYGSRAVYSPDGQRTARAL
jgi:hypothetical protein